MVLLPLGQMKSLQRPLFLPLLVWFLLHLGDTHGSQPCWLSFLKLFFFPKTKSPRACTHVECQPGQEEENHAERPKGRKW